MNNEIPDPINPPDPRTEAVHHALQVALTLIQAKAEGRPLDPADADLGLLLAALITIGATMATTFDKPIADVIEALRMQVLTTLDDV
jgi:hypothetical protein